MFHAGYFGLAKESEFGRAVAPTAFLPLRSDVHQETAATRAVAPWGSTLGEPRPFAFQGGAQAEVEAQPDAFGHLLTAVLGAPQTIPFNGVFRHVWEYRGGRPTYTVEVGADTLALRASGAQALSLAFGVAAGARLQAQVAFVTRQIAPVALGTATYVAEEAPLWSTATVQVSGTADTALSSFAMNVFAPGRAIGGWSSAGRFAAAAPGGMSVAQLAFVAEGVSSAWIGRFRDQQELSTTITLTGRLVGTTSYQVIIECPRFRVSGMNVPVANRNLPRMNVQGVPFGSTAAGRGVKITIVNSTMGY